MAIFHLSVKTVSRSAGRSAVAAVAYRTAERLVDQRTGELHDYRRKSGVEFTELFLPKGAPEWAHIRDALWNAAEQAETRKNSTVAREFEIALPAELSAQQRERLARDLAQEIVERHRCAVDLAIHAPGKAGDNRNHHAHILLTTRRLEPQGFTEKTRELDDRKSREVDRWRERFAQLQNERLREYGHEVRVDHRSLEAQGIERQPTRHLGPTAAAIERRTGKPSRKRLDFEREVAERLTQAKEAGELERQARAVDRSILDLSGDLRAALQEREREQRQEQERQQAIEAVKPLAASGMAEFRRQFELHRLAEAGKERARQEFQAEQERQRQAAERAEQARQEALRQQEQQRQLEQQREAEKQRAHQRRQDGPSWSR
jgi:hypothetical protein